MKKTNLTLFDSNPTYVADLFAIQTEEYLKQLLINKISVHPLKSIQGNLDSKTGKDTVIIFLNGSGSMEVNGSNVPVTAGDMIFVNSNEVFNIKNDTLDSSLQFISVLIKK